jgi:drug/metabolite transporter (DMT)-like permease
MREEREVRSETRSLKILAAFAAIYLVWGATYLAVRIGLESLPPFLLAASRFLIAGGALYAWLRLRGVPRPSDSQWWSAAITGTLMMVGGSGGVTWAEQWVPSGIAALLVATVPLWMTVIDVFVLRRSRASWRVVAGVALGIAGVVVLVGPSSAELGAVDLVGGLVVVGAALCWSVGSLVSRGARQPDSPAMTVAVQMVTGGAVLLVVSGVVGEWQGGFSLSAVTVRSAAAVLYLAALGSIVTLTAYVWLLRQVSAPAVATYAFVNPVVAVFLGWVFAAEPINRPVVAASALIIGAVVLIQSQSWRRVLRRSRRPVTPLAVPAVARTCESAPVCRECRS